MEDREMVKEGNTYTRPLYLDQVFEDMYEASLFTFNNRKQPLEVIFRRDDHDVGAEAPEYDGYIEARIPERENATTHSFHWGYSYNGVKHKPRPNQTNNVEQVTPIKIVFN